MKNQGKTGTLHFKVTPEFKALLVKQAEETHRSLMKYFEWLLLQEAAKTEPKNRRGSPV